MDSMEPLVLNIDASDGDWIKRGSWDIPAANVEDLREWLFWQQMPVEEFKKLDVYLGNVERMPWLKDL
jgi:hypothetical protein